jgi:hypothetical protein
MRYDLFKYLMPWKICAKCARESDDSLSKVCSQWFIIKDEEQMPAQVRQKSFAWK